MTGGQTVDRETPIDVIPLYVKAGAIIPFGPEVQYAQHKDWSALEIRIYPGSDGQFVLYEDEFDNYNYEKGAFSEIVFHWDDSTRNLTIEERKGTFSGMLEKRNFSLLLMGKEPSSQTLEYAGQQVQTSF